VPFRSSNTAFERPRLRVVAGGREQDGSQPTDDEIIDAVKRCDHRLAGGLYDRLCAVIDGTLFRLMGRREDDHDDLVQCVFEQVVSTIMRDRFARECSLSTWASSVAAHVGLNALRAKTRERRVVNRSAQGDLEAGYARSTANVEREAGARQELERLRRNLAAMPRDKAETVLLHDVLGHELADIAKLMGVSVAAAQSRLVRGRRELASRMGQTDTRSDEGEGS